MLNFLLWLISLQANIVDKLIRLTNKNTDSYTNNSAVKVEKIEYFCWCITDRNEIVGNPVVISASDPNTAALEYYINHVPKSAKVALTTNGRTLTTLSRPVK